MKWTGDKEKFDVVSLKTFEKHEVYELETEYKVRYRDNKNYKATLLFIGTKIECEAKERLLMESLKDEALKSKIAKTPAPKCIAANTTEIRNECHNEFQEARINQLEIKLKQSEDLVNKQVDEIKKLKQENEDIKKTLASRDNGMV